MTAKEKLLKFAKEKKIFRARDADKELGVSARVYLQRLADEGRLVKAGYGLYRLAESNLTEMQDILETAVKVPNGVLCLLSALRFHDLTTQNPFEVWMALEKGMRIPKVETVPARFFTFAPNVYRAGVETHIIVGVEVKVYSAAKTIMDCFRYQSTVGFDVGMEALREAWTKRKATMDELYHFAELRNIKKKMTPYLRTLN